MDIYCLCCVPVPTCVAECARNGGYICHWGHPFLSMCLWWSFCTLYLLARQVELPQADSGLRGCVPCLSSAIISLRWCYNKSYRFVTTASNRLAVFGKHFRAFFVKAHLGLDTNLLPLYWVSVSTFQTREGTTVTDQFFARKRPLWTVTIFFFLPSPRSKSRNSRKHRRLLF